MSKIVNILVVVCLLASGLGVALADDDNSTTTVITPSPSSASTPSQPGSSSSSSPTTPHSTISPDNPCTIYSNTTCEQCLKNDKCFYCKEDETCKPYKIKGIFPEGCAASKARWISCSLNFQALFIAAISLGAVILIIIFSCICYCCNKSCKAISDRQLNRLEKKYKRQKEAILERNKEKRVERQAKNEEIRAKYGLKPATYSKFDTDD